MILSPFTPLCALGIWIAYFSIWYVTLFSSALAKFGARLGGTTISKLTTKCLPDNRVTYHFVRCRSMPSICSSSWKTVLFHHDENTQYAWRTGIGIFVEHSDWKYPFAFPVETPKLQKGRPAIRVSSKKDRQSGMNEIVQMFETVYLEPGLSI